MFGINLLPECNENIYINIGVSRIGYDHNQYLIGSNIFLLPWYKEQLFQFRLIRKQIMSCYLGLIFWKPEIPQGTCAYFILACINSFYFFTWWQMSRSLWYFFFILRKNNQICTWSCYLCIKINYAPIL